MWYSVLTEKLCSIAVYSFAEYTSPSARKFFRELTIARGVAVFSERSLK